MDINDKHYLQFFQSGSMTTENINLANKPFGPRNGEYYSLDGPGKVPYLRLAGEQAAGEIILNRFEKSVQKTGAKPRSKNKKH